MAYDYLIVGAGLYGAVVAAELKRAHKKVLVLEKANHPGGACHTEKRDGLLVQAHGGHIFHTDSREIWEYVQRFGCWRQYSHHVKASYGGKVYSFPINLMTLQQVFGVKDAGEARKLLADVRKPATEDNLKAWAISQVGERLYEMFIEGYTRKQWGRDPAELPASIIKRLPIRLNWSDEYFSDDYQGLPAHGYTAVIAAMLEGVDVAYEQNYLARRTYWDFKADMVIYTGPIDELFGFVLGRLEYRSLRFEHERIETDDFQGSPTINYTDGAVPFTRILEHKHWYPANVKHTLITREYPAVYDGSNEAYYPVNDAKNQRLYELYKAALPSQKNLTVGGRLGLYRYLDMAPVVGAALKTAKELLQ